MQNKVAEQILEKVQNQILKKYYMLTPIINQMQLCPVSKECILETDGVHIYYQPKQICHMAQRKEWKELAHQYLHIMLHGILFHYVDYSKYSMLSLANAIFDLEVDIFLKHLEGRQETNFERLEIDQILESQGAKGLYTAALQSKILRRDIYRAAKLVAKDHHVNWQQRQKSKEEEENGNAQSGMMQCETEMSQNQQETCLQFWTSLVDCCMEGVNKEERGVFSGMYGNGSAWNEDIVSKDDSDVLDYTDIIKAALQEMVCETDPERFDRDLYALGMEMYEDVALLEPPEEGEQYSIGTIAIAIDTSGSCGGDIVRTFLTQTEGILQTLSNIKYEEVVIFQADAEICDELHLQSGDSFPDFTQMKMFGFGGTDFCPVFERVEEMNEESPVDLLIYLTDAFGSFPKNASQIKTYFVIPDMNENREMYRNLDIPKWIECISL